MSMNYSMKLIVIGHSRQKPDHNATKFKTKNNRDLGSRFDGDASSVAGYPGHYGDDEDRYDDNAYDSSESTDVDESLPRNTNTSPQIGSKKATEVLSSKTADYRPPMLGSWVTIDSKPFGIIDGMSTRSLQHHHHHHHHQQQPLNNKSQEPRGMTDDHRSYSNASHPALSSGQSLNQAISKRKALVKYDTMCNLKCQ